MRGQLMDMLSARMKAIEMDASMGRMMEALMG